MSKKILTAFLIVIAVLFLNEINSYANELIAQESEELSKEEKQIIDNLIIDSEITNTLGTEKTENSSMLDEAEELKQDNTEELLYKIEELEMIEQKEDNSREIENIELSNDNNEDLEETLGQSIEDGIYRIESALDLNKVLDISNGSMENRANLQIWTDKNDEQQKFLITYIMEEDYYKIQVFNSGKMLDVQNEDIYNGANVQQYEEHETDAQKWIIKDTEDGYYNIISKCNNLYLDVYGANTSNGTNVQMYEGNGTNAQKFNLVKIKENSLKVGQSIADGTYNIKLALDSNKVLDISEGLKENSANLQIWTDSNVEQQEFIITLMEDGYYKIQAVHSNKVLDVQGANKSSGANVQQYEPNNTDAQKWIIKKTTDGYYNIISKCNNLYLDVYNANTSNGTNVQMYKGNGTNAQKFIFIDINEKNILPEKTIQDGTYKIECLVDLTKVLDISAGDKDNRANLQIWDNCGVQQQKFIVKSTEDGYYKIQAVHSGKYLDVQDESKNNGANIQQYNGKDIMAQEWIIKETKDGYYNIISKCNNLYMDICGANTSNGANVQTYERNETNAQKFKFIKTQIIDNGTYEILTVANDNMVLGVDTESENGDIELQIIGHATMSYQKFFFEYKGNNEYVIKVKSSDNLLTTEENNMNNGANVFQGINEETERQRWILELTNDGEYNFKSKYNNLYLDITGGVLKNGTRIQMYEKNNTDAQKFKICNVTTYSGIDVSDWQETINWEAAKNSGVDFAILRIGYGRYSNQKDLQFEKNYSECKKLNIPIGIYLYSYATDEDGAYLEAQNCLNWLAGRDIELPIFYDLEDSSISNLSKDKITNIAITFTNQIKKSGYKAGVYANMYWLSNKIDVSKLNNCDIWLAHYTWSADIPSSYEGRYSTWQYSNEGSVNGIQGYVDLNIRYTSTA